MLVTVVFEEHLQFPDADIGSRDELVLFVVHLDLTFGSREPPLDEPALESRLGRATGRSPGAPNVQGPLQYGETRATPSAGRRPGTPTRLYEPRRLNQLLAERAVDEIAEFLGVHQASGCAIDDRACRRGATDPASNTDLTGGQLRPERARPPEPPAGSAGDRHLRDRRRLCQPKQCRRRQVRGDRAARTGQAGDHRPLFPAVGCPGNDIDLPGDPPPLPGVDPVSDLVVGQPGPDGLVMAQRAPLPGSDAHRLAVGPADRLSSALPVDLRYVASCHSA